MNLENVMIAAIVAVVIICALWKFRIVNFKATADGLGLSANKNPEKDKVSVKNVTKSEVDIENREGQDIEVEAIKEDSNVKIK
jgi:hypothetical protein